MVRDEGDMQRQVLIVETCTCVGGVGWMGFVWVWMWNIFPLWEGLPSAMHGAWQPRHSSATAVCIWSSCLTPLLPSGVWDNNCICVFIQLYYVVPTIPQCSPCSEFTLSLRLPLCRHRSLDAQFHAAPATPRDGQVAVSRSGACTRLRCTW